MQESTKKIKIVRAISVIVFLLILFLIYHYLNFTFSRKDSYAKNGAFMSETKDFDVLFLGTSHMVDAVYPMELWNQYGIFSYNLAGPMNEISVSYWQLINALDHTMPELVVLDCSRVSNMSLKVEKSMGLMHKTFDFFPLSKNKIIAADNLFNENDEIGFIWKLYLYHSRWNELGEQDFNPVQSVEKGAQALARVAIPDEMKLLDRSEKLKNETVGSEYLRKIIELCQDKDIDILLTYLPFPADENQIRESNTVNDIAEEYGINYLNFLYMDDLVDFDTDCNDSNSHLNSSGGRKITEYLGEYIRTNYEVADRRETDTYHSWHEEYEKYTDFKIELIQKQTSLDSNLMLLRDKNISSCIYVREDSEILRDERMVKLIKNVSPYVDLTQIDTAIQSGSEYFAVIDNGLCDIWESVGGQSLENISTTFGYISYFSNNGNPSLFIHESEENYFCELTENGGSPDVQIVTMNKLTGEVVHKSSYAVADYDEYGNVIASRVY